MTHIQILDKKQERGAMWYRVTEGASPVWVFAEVILDSLRFGHKVTIENTEMLNERITYAEVDDTEEGYDIYEHTVNFNEGQYEETTSEYIKTYKTLKGATNFTQAKNYALVK